MYTAALGIEERVAMGTESDKGLLNRYPVQLEGLMTFGILLWIENANSVVLLTNRHPLFQRKCRFKEPERRNKSDDIHFPDVAAFAPTAYLKFNRFNCYRLW